MNIWIRGDHIYEKLNSLSFPGDFQDIFKFFPEQLKREIFDGVHLCFWSHHMFFIFPEFSRFFFLKKFKFSWDFDNFSNSLSFPYFPGLWPPCHNSIWFGQRNYKVTCISCISRWHILLWLWLKSWETHLILIGLMKPVNSKYSHCPHSADRQIVLLFCVHNLFSCVKPV